MICGRESYFPLAQDSSSLAFAGTAPDAVFDSEFECVIEATLSNWAAAANCLGPLYAGAITWKEDRRWMDAALAV